MRISFFLYGLGNPGYDKQGVLYQTDFPSENTVYVVRYDFVLGEDITIPENCVFEFDGGSVSGEHTLTGTNTGVKAGLVKIFDVNITFAGTWNAKKAFVEWFGAKGDGIADDTIPIQKTIDFAINGNIVNVLLGSKRTYKITSTLNTTKAVCLDGQESEIFLPNSADATCLIRVGSHSDGLYTHVKNLKIRGYVGGYDSYIVEDGLTQNGVPLCREGVIGMDIACFGVNVENIWVVNCHYGISSFNNDNTWCPSLNGVYIRSCYYALYFKRERPMNAGERLNISNSIIGNNVIAIHSDLWGVNVSMCSIDYNMYCTKNSNTGLASFAYMSFVNCYFERGNIVGNSWFLNTGGLSLTECTLVEMNSTPYFFETCSYVKLTSCSFSANNSIVADNSTRLYMENCDNILGQGLLLPNTISNLIKNGDFSTDDVSAFSAGGTGTCEVAVDEQGNRYLKITPELYHGNEYYVSFYPRKDFYLFYKTVNNGSPIYTHVIQYDRDGNGVGSGFYTPTQPGYIDYFKIVLMPNVEKVTILRQFSGGDSTVCHDFGIYAFEF